MKNLFRRKELAHLDHCLTLPPEPWKRPRRVELIVRSDKRTRIDREAAHSGGAEVEAGLHLRNLRHFHPEVLGYV